MGTTEIEVPRRIQNFGVFVNRYAALFLSLATLAVRGVSDVGISDVG